MKFQPPPRVVSQTEYISVSADGEDAWKTMDLVDILQRGGVGVLPTDTGYGFVTPLDSKQGLERLLRIKGIQDCKKPLSLLCSNLKTIDEFCFGIDKAAFKVLKKNLPGPYTFILPAKNTLPNGIVMDIKGGKHSWKRQTLGVRIPNDPVLRYLQDDLLDGMPLLVSSLPILGMDDDDDDFMTPSTQLIDCQVDMNASWCNQVDFVVDAGTRPYDGSTIFDLSATRGEPILVREGLGELQLVQ
ncbi:yrdC domain containing (E. coli) [Seminavis robusta]|uniref:Threonylcarbamoyl-AMP synthase n=1 Tax=Seminavis robusta TaxID=568900 RepID=A0A9N8DIK9_9STRA|nr:yrdC domain containing (E. coli) [Seminavis robusta]|eukprot:Sro146_g067620.1 yrdC domain containing (E. coli) (243) ;mRNA; r:72823-73551